MHGGEVKIKDNLAIRMEPLGIVVFVSGTDCCDKSQVRVCTVQLQPVDLTDFWNTKTMVVNSGSCNCEPVMSSEDRERLRIINEACELSDKHWAMGYPWKRNPKDLPDNYNQVLSKLQATERRLAKQPKHAVWYNSQMIEMEERKFSRKLTEKEIKEWKGHVYYVSHHGIVRPEKKSTPLRIVFNSSVPFQGHCLNDYWYKGPDLNNNLFGVILRFREKIGICGDI